MDDDAEGYRAEPGHDAAIEWFVWLINFPWLAAVACGVGWLAYHLARFIWRSKLYPAWRFLASSWLEILGWFALAAALLAAVVFLAWLLLPTIYGGRIRLHYWSLYAADHRRYRRTRRILRKAYREARLDMRHN